jgi:hypothetical protein
MEFRGDYESARCPIRRHTGKASVLVAIFVVARATRTLPLPAFSFYADGVRVEFRGDPSMEGVGNVGLGWNSVGTVGGGFPIARWSLPIF